MFVTFNMLGGLTEQGELTCLQCNKEFIPTNHSQKYCGYACVAASQRVIIRKVCIQCGGSFNSTNANRKEKFCGQYCHGLSVRGVNSPFWKGGTTPLFIKLRKSPEGLGWRRKVFERDGYMCQECNQYGGKLIPHHILSFANYEDRRFDVENGITLCYKCHKLLHTVYGKGGLVIPWGMIL